MCLSVLFIVFTCLATGEFTFNFTQSRTILISFNCCSNLDSVLQRANDTEYGLAAGVFTQNINRALEFSRRIEAGTVFVNTYNKTDVAAPFGGYKRSGIGKDLGKTSSEIFFHLSLLYIFSCLPNEHQASPCFPQNVKQEMWCTALDESLLLQRGGKIMLEPHYLVGNHLIPYSSGHIFYFFFSCLCFNGTQFLIFKVGSFFFELLIFSLEFYEESFTISPQTFH